MDTMRSSFGMGYQPEESIYNLIQEQEIAPEKPAMYKSTNRAKATSRPCYSTFGGDVRPKATLGPATVDKPVPKRFLKAGEKSKIRLPPPTKFTYPEDLTGSRKPTVPRKEEKPIMGLVTTKDFVTANAVENILAVPKKRVDEPVRYTNKPDYGKVPNYLGKVKEEVQQEYDYIQGLQQMEEDEYEEGERMFRLDDQERVNLVNGLKKQWDVKNARYNGLPMVLESENQKQLKEQLEKDLEQLEKDIDRLMKPNVFVGADREW